METGSKKTGKGTWQAALSRQGMHRAMSATGEFCLLIARRFYFDGCLGMAGSLTFTTLLALVPLITVVLGVLSMFPAFHDLAGNLQHLLVNQLVPTSGVLVQHYLTQFAVKASRLTIMGSFWLLATALLTLFTIDMALNSIWRTSHHRDILVVFIVYWALLTLGPLLFGTGFMVTSYVFTQYRSLFGPTQGSMMEWLGLQALSLLLETLTFALLFVLVPRTRVSLLHASIGGLLTAVLFEFAKRAFSFYVAHFKNYELIYGTFSVIPIFLMWVYLSWLIVLLGAEVTACLSLHCHRTRIPDAVARRSLRFGLRLIGSLAHAQWQGQGVSSRYLSAQEPEFTPPQVEMMLEHLAQLEYIRQVGAQWFLVRDLRGVSVYEFYRQGDFSLRLSGPHGAPETMGELDQCLDALLQRAEMDIRTHLDFPVSHLWPGLSEGGSELPRVAGP